MVDNVKNLKERLDAEEMKYEPHGVDGIKIETGKVYTREVIDDTIDTYGMDEMIGIIKKDIQRHRQVTN